MFNVNFMFEDKGWQNFTRGWQNFTRDQIYDELEKYITQLSNKKANLEEVFSFINGVLNNKGFSENEIEYLKPYSSEQSIKDILSDDKAKEGDVIDTLIQGLTEFKKKLNDVIADRNRARLAQDYPPPQNIFTSADEIGPRGLEIFKKAGIEIIHKVKNMADNTCEKILQCKETMTMEDAGLFHKFIHNLKLNVDEMGRAYYRLKELPSIFIKEDKLSSIEAMEKAFQGEGYENLSKLIESNKNTLGFDEPIDQSNYSYTKRANLITAIALGVKNKDHIREITSNPSGTSFSSGSYASNLAFGLGTKREGISKYLPGGRITRNKVLNKLMMESLDSISENTKEKIINKFWELHNRSYEFAENKKEEAYNKLSISISTKGDSYMQSLAFQEFDSLNANSYQKDLHWNANHIPNPEFDSIFPADDSVFTKGTNIRNNLKTMIRLTEEELKKYSPKLRQHIENTEHITDVRYRMLSIFKLMQKDAIEVVLPPLIMLYGAGCQFADSQEEFMNNMSVLGAQDTTFTVDMGNKFFKEDTLNTSSFSPIYSVEYLKKRINNIHHFFHNGVAYNFISDLGELGSILDPENVENSGPVKLKNKNIENFKKIEPNEKKYLETRLKLIRNEGCLPFGDLLLKEDEAEKDKVTKDKVTNYKVISLDEDSEQKEIMQVKIGEIKGQTRLRVFNTIIEGAAKNIEDILHNENIPNENSLKIVQAFILSIAQYNDREKTSLGGKKLCEKEDFLALLNNNIMRMGIEDVTLNEELAKTVSAVIQDSGKGLSNTISNRHYEETKDGEITIIDRGARTHRLAKAMLQQYGSIDEMRNSFEDKLKEKLNEPKKGMMSLVE